MRWEEKYPDAKWEDQYDGGMVWIDHPENPAPCCVCDSPTIWADIDYQAPFCSEECGEYFERELDEIDKRQNFKEGLYNKYMSN